MYSLTVLVLSIFVSQHIGVVSGSVQQISRPFSKYILHEGLLNFLSGSIHNFPTWVKKNKLNPFQLTGEFVTVEDTNTNITLTVTNQYATGFSEVSHIFNSAVSVGLDARSFSVSFATNDKILFGGEYEATGLYHGNISLNLRGQFSIVCEEFWQGISFDNLTISDNDNYIHLYSGNGTYSSVPTFENISFTNISFDGDQNSETIPAIVQELGSICYKLIAGKISSRNSTLAIPSSRLFHRYINTLFWKTKLTDILNWSSVSNWDAINHSNSFVPNVFVFVLMLFFNLKLHSLVS